MRELRADIPTRTDTLFADAVYRDEFQLDAAHAARLYESVLASPSLAAEARREATWRLARAYRRDNRVRESRALLSELLLAADLTPRLREIVEREMAALPADEPARLIDADRTVYMEMRQPGVTLLRLAHLLRAADLPSEPQSNLGRWFTAARALTDADWDAETLAAIRAMGALGVGLRDVDIQFERSSDPRLSANVVLALFTGDSPATVGVVEGVVSNIIAAPVQVDGAAVFTVAGANRAPQFVWADGLFVIASELSEAVAVLRRYRGEAVERTLAETPLGRANPLQAGADVRIAIDWPRLIDGLDRSQTRLLRLAPFSRLLVDLQLVGEELEFDLRAAWMDAAPTTLPPAPPLDRAWSQWLPERAMFAAAASVNAGATRWRQFVGALRRIKTSESPAIDEAAPLLDDAVSWIDRLRNEDAARVAQLADGLQAIGYVMLPPPAADLSPAHLLILELREPSDWIAQLDRLLAAPFGDPSLHVLRADALAAGEALTVGLPWTPFRVSLQLRGRRLIVAAAPGTLQRYRGMIDDANHALVSVERDAAAVVHLRPADFIEPGVSPNGHVRVLVWEEVRAIRLAGRVSRLGRQLNALAPDR